MMELKRASCSTSIYPIASHTHVPDGILLEAIFAGGGTRLSTCNEGSRAWHSPHPDTDDRKMTQLAADSTNCDLGGDGAISSRDLNCTCLITGFTGPFAGAGRAGTALPASSEEHLESRSSREFLPVIPLLLLLPLDEVDLVSESLVLAVDFLNESGGAGKAAGESESVEAPSSLMEPMIDLLMRLTDRGESRKVDDYVHTYMARGGRLDKEIMRVSYVVVQ
ncbi:hypothetical protein ACLOJK_039348 [Asimina triloba]